MPPSRGSAAIRRARRHTVSLLDGIKAQLAGKAEVVHAQGVFITAERGPRGPTTSRSPIRARNRELIAEAVEVAQDRRRRHAGHRRHRADQPRGLCAATTSATAPSLDLVGEQNELFDALQALGKPVVVVALNGRPPSWPNVVAEAPTRCSNAGTSARKAARRWPRRCSATSIPAASCRSPWCATSGRSRSSTTTSLRRGAATCSPTSSPLFPFGFGLSYTTFEIPQPRLSATQDRARRRR